MLNKRQVIKIYQLTEKDMILELSFRMVCLLTGKHIKEWRQYLLQNVWKPRKYM
jgi:hypothetical protein